MGILNNSNAISVDSGYDITDSLRFRASASAYLSRTPTSDGNKKTWTFSCWTKRGTLTGSQVIFSAANSANSQFVDVTINGNNVFELDILDSNSTRTIRTSTAVLRDPSAWYHIVLVIDTTQAIDTNRIKLYVNNKILTTSAGSGTFPNQNADTQVNATTGIHAIARRQGSADRYYDAYLTEIQHIDGTALAPSDFGETDDNGIWIPKRYTGTYGTNGFYLPMKPTTQATGFNTVLYAGNSASQTITGVGFAPDLVWYKRRTGSNDNTLIDSVRGGANALSANGTAAEYQFGSNDLSFTSTGFTLTDPGTATNASGQNYVAWCWNAGGSTVTNTNGTINSQVRANPSTGFSIATWTNDSSGDDTVGHGLGVAPKLIITKLRSTSGDWYTQTTAIDGGLDYLKLNDTNAAASLPKALPTADVFTTDMGGTTTAVAYSFADVTGYQKIGSYTGNGSTTGPSVTGLGFQPAWILIKSTSIADEWVLFDNTRNSSNPTNLRLNPNSDGSEQSSQSVNILSDGFQPITTGGNINQSGATYIYMAIADTRDAKFNFDASGNKNNWTPNNINSNASGESSYDLMSDVPTLTDEDTSNFATLNPNNMAVNTTMTDGNLKASNSSNHATMFPTNMPTTGKYYFECKMAVNAVLGLGFRTDTNKVESAYSDEANKYYFYLNNSNAYRIVETSNTALGSNLNSTSSTFQVAIDFDAAKYYFGVNNTWYAADWGTDGDPASGANPSYDLTDGTKMFPFVYVAGGTWTVNFGQQPFNYTPPTGFKKLNTYNLPDSTIEDGSQHFDTLTWSGNGAVDREITGLEFQPDFTWIKSRSNAVNHWLMNSVNGARKGISSNNNGAEQAFDQANYDFESFDSNGFSVSPPYYAHVNTSGHTFVGWNWKGNGTGSSNTDGSITSTVSANTTAGFSVVTYSGNGSAATVGHGLGAIPDMIITKNRSATNEWCTWHKDLSGAFDYNGAYIYLNTTAQAYTTSVFYDGTGISSTRVAFRGGTGEVNASGNNYVMYAFKSVEGYSKFDKYTGNGSTDGPFIYTGFRPSFLIVKRSSTTGEWRIMDSTRTSYNWTSNILFAENTAPENTSEGESTYGVDLLSNGFKIRASHEAYNTSGATYIYMAFAENPFKNSNAR